MADYKKMYHIICKAASQAIDEPPEKAKQLLQIALYEAEEIYIRTYEDGEDENEPRHRYGVLRIVPL